MKGIFLPLNFSENNMPDIKALWYIFSYDTYENKTNLSTKNTSPNLNLTEQSLNSIVFQQMVWTLIENFADIEQVQ